MNKKQKEVASEDLEIRRVAYFKNSSQLLLLLLILLFSLTFFCTLIYLGKFYMEKFIITDDTKIIEVKTRDNIILITNNGVINKTINEDDIKFNKEYLIENKSTIKITTKKNANSNSSTNLNIKYNIVNNDFTNQAIASTNNDVLVRFMYSYDNENWKYVNNVISTTNSTLSPLMGSYYDISGLVGNLKVLTNFKLENKIGNNTKMYWKCETLIRNIEDNVGKNIQAEFKIEYNDNN